MRVLLVEDSVALADELLPLLARSGYAVDWVVDGRDASVRASDENYDVAVLDLGLPGRNGLECCATGARRACRWRCWC